MQDTQEKPQQLELLDQEMVEIEALIALYQKKARVLASMRNAVLHGER